MSLSNFISKLESLIIENQENIIFSNLTTTIKDFESKKEFRINIKRIK
jgi:hypothetical protein